MCSRFFFLSQVHYKKNYLCLVWDCFENACDGGFLAVDMGGPSARFTYSEVVTSGFQHMAQHVVAKDSVSLA